VKPLNVKSPDGDFEFKIEINVPDAKSNDAGDFSKIKYPEELAPRGHYESKYLRADGKTAVHVRDPYRFLENPDSEETKRWVRAENELSSKFLK